MSPSIQPPPGTADADAKARVALDQVRLAMGNRSTARIVSLLGTLAVAGMLGRVYPWWIPLCWLLVGMVTTAYRFIQTRRFPRQALDAATVEYWRGNIVSSAVLYGMLWGMASALFAWAGDPMSLVGMILVLVGGLLGGFWMVSIHRAYLVFALLVAVPPFALLALSHPGTYEFFALTALLATVAAIQVAASLRRLISETLYLRQEKEQALALLAQQTARAETSSHEKSLFLASASHDLRQPLQALTMFTAALDPHVETAQGRHLLRRTTQSLQSLTDMFNALLDMSRLENGVVPMVSQPVALAPLFEELRLQFQPLAEARGLHLRVAPVALAVQGDAVQLQRMIGNLLSNAFNHTPAGSIWLGVRRAGTRLRIEVRDSGIGIPAADHQAIFREFYQLANPERDRRKGLGLGLAIVARIARQLGYDTAVRSALGRGSVFSIVAPRAPLPAVCAGDRLSTIPALDLSGLSVLVVEDDEDVRESIEAKLRQWNCDTWLADGVDAAAGQLALRGGEPDLILCDYRLRGDGNGLEAIARLRQLARRDIPAALISGDVDNGSLVRARSSGVTVIRKPVSPASLSTLLRGVARGRRVPRHPQAA